jgi:hypothetical protein
MWPAIRADEADEEGTLERLKTGAGAEAGVSGRLAGDC